MPPLRRSVKARLANLGIYGKPKNARKTATGKAGASKKTRVRGTEEYGENAGQVRVLHVELYTVWFIVVP